MNYSNGMHKSSFISVPRPIVGKGKENGTVSVVLSSSLTSGFSFISLIN